MTLNLTLEFDMIIWLLSSCNDSNILLSYSTENLLQQLRLF